MTDEDCVGPELCQCEICGATGLPERIHPPDGHDCQAFLEWRAE